MSARDPILILQMQRMGDLVLSFPLAGWLNSLYPDTPVWVVGEHAFFEGLIEISPPITYFSYADSAVLEKQSFSSIINLSHRSEAAELAGRLNTERRIGPFMVDGLLHISGSWQLYRASISHNNRHNLFHWADLNAMDIVPQASMLRTAWPPLKAASGADAPRVGLFVGASEADKRPEPEFWAELAAKLMRGGAKPVFLGGVADMPLAAAAAAILNAPAMNLAGHFSIIQLCRFIAGLELLIVPDTGPMHIAAWTGVPVLNISVGPVNPWETGPFAPGHHVLCPSLSCTGCWQCTQPSVLCKERLKASQIALIAEYILAGEAGRLAGLDSSAGHIYRTARDDYGLFNLQPINLPLSGKERGPALRQSIAAFWKLFFGLELGFIKPGERPAAELEAHKETMFAASLNSALLEAGQKMLTSLLRAIQGRALDANQPDLRSEDFWLAFSPLFRPLSSYIQFILHNGNFSHAALTQSLQLTESYIAALRGSRS